MQRGITYLVTVRVVERLEVVDVEEQNREGPVESVRPLELVVDRGDKSAMVWQTGCGIDGRKGCKLGLRDRQLFVRQRKRVLCVHLAQRQ